MLLVPQFLGRFAERPVKDSNARLNGHGRVLVAIHPVFQPLDGSRRLLARQLLDFVVLHGLRRSAARIA